MSSGAPVMAIDCRPTAPGGPLGSTIPSGGHYNLLGNGLGGGRREGGGVFEWASVLHGSERGNIQAVNVNSFFSLYFWSVIMVSVKNLRQANTFLYLSLFLSRSLCLSVCLCVSLSLQLVDQLSSIHSPRIRQR